MSDTASAVDDRMISCLDDPSHGAVEEIGVQGLNKAPLRL
jgi:hypothetical protein